MRIARSRENILLIVLALVTVKNTGIPSISGAYLQVKYTSSNGNTIFVGYVLLQTLSSGHLSSSDLEQLSHRKYARADSTSHKPLSGTVSPAEQASIHWPCQSLQLSFYPATNNGRERLDSLHLATTPLSQFYSSRPSPIFRCPVAID